VALHDLTVGTRRAGRPGPGAVQIMADPSAPGLLPGGGAVGRLSAGRPGSPSSSVFQLTAVVAFAMVAWLSCQILRPTSGLTALDVFSIVVVPLSLRVIREYVWIYRYCVALCVWLAAMALSSVVNGTGTGGLMQHAAYPGLQLTGIFVLVWASHRLSTPTCVVLAVLGSQMYYVYFLREILYSNPWKFGLATPTICLVLVLLARTKHWRLGSLVALVLFAGVSMLQDARGLAGMCLLAALLLVVIRPSWRARSGAYFYSRVGIAVVAILVSVAAAYSIAAGSGQLGVDAERKFAEQSAGDNLLLVARPELAFSIRAIMHSPFIGSGGAPSLTVQDVTEGIADLAEAGGVTTDSAVQRIIGGGVNAHSLFFESWIHAGALAVVPWLLLIGLGLRAIRRAAPAWQPLLLFWTIAVTWDIFFSPWTPRYHLLLAAFVLIVCRLVDNDRRSADPAARGLRAWLRPVPARFTKGGARTSG
jgi:hypothetical protein